MLCGVVWCGWLVVCLWSSYIGMMMMIQAKQAKTGRAADAVRPNPNTPGTPSSNTQDSQSKWGLDSGGNRPKRHGLGGCAPPRRPPAGVMMRVQSKGGRVWNWRVRTAEQRMHWPGPHPFGTQGQVEWFINRGEGGRRGVACGLGSTEKAKQSKPTN